MCMEKPKKKETHTHFRPWYSDWPVLEGIFDENQYPESDYFAPEQNPPGFNLIWISPQKTQCDHNLSVLMGYDSSLLVLMNQRLIISASFS